MFFVYCKAKFNTSVHRFVHRLNRTMIIKSKQLQQNKIWSLDTLGHIDHIQRFNVTSQKR